MSPITVVRKGPSLIAQEGPAASTTYIFPETSPQVRRRAAPVMGLVPTSPVTADAYTSVTPLLLRIANVPAVPKLTGAGPAPFALKLLLLVKLPLAPPHPASNNAMNHSSGLNELSNLVI